MRRLVVAALATSALALTSGSAVAATLPVDIVFRAFTPSSIDVLPADTVTWTNTGGLFHTVTADDGEFDSGNIFNGGHFTLTFKTPGAYAYHCTIHPSMVGEVDVRRVTLGPLPAGLVPIGASVDVSGRAADPTATVTIESDTGTGFQTVATTSPRPDGTWNARVLATTGRFRAVSGSDTSETRQLHVVDSTVRAQAVRGGILVTVTPADPHGLVSLQLNLRERFGWWPVAQTRLNRRSQARFRVRGPAWARVALLDRDGWTALALSPSLHLRGR
jgi:plastocyanin